MHIYIIVIYDLAKLVFSFRFSKCLVEINFWRGVFVGLLSSGFWGMDAFVGLWSGVALFWFVLVAVRMLMVVRIINYQVSFLVVVVGNVFLTRVYYRLLLA